MKFFIVTIFVIYISACCTRKPDHAEKMVETPDAASPKEELKAVDLRSAKNKEYIFSGVKEISESRISDVLQTLGVEEVRSLGGNQFLIRFNSEVAELQVSGMLQKNQISGSLSRNLEYKIPAKPLMKNQKQNKLRQ